MQMYNLIEYSNNYSKTSGILWLYCRDDLTLDAANGGIDDFNPANTTTKPFNLKVKVNRSNR